jgi:hypothetical protein
VRDQNILETTGLDQHGVTGGAWATFGLRPLVTRLRNYLLICYYLLQAHLFSKSPKNLKKNLFIILILSAVLCTSVIHAVDFRTLRFPGNVSDTSW